LWGWALAACWLFCRIALVGWATLVLYYSNLPWSWLRLALATAFAVFSIWALWGARQPRMRWTFAGLFLIVLAWFVCIPPSHDRPWRREVAVMQAVAFGACWWA
jgi:hypothetical protein